MHVCTVVASPYKVHGYRFLDFEKSGGLKGKYNVNNYLDLDLVGRCSPRPLGGF